VDALRDHRQNDLRRDLDDHRVRCNANRHDHHVTDDRLGNRRNDLRDDDHRLRADDHQRMGYLCEDDLKMDVNLGVSRDRRMSGTDDRKMDENRGHRMSGPQDDLMMDVSHDLRMNGTDDRKMDVSHVNRRSGVHPNAQLVYEHRVDLKIDPECYVLRDRKMGGTTGAMSRHVKLTGDPSMSCDRMSHDRLRYDHLTMRHRDTNRLDGKNPDVNHRMKDGLMTIRLVNWWKSHCVDLTIDPECYYPMMDVRMRILVMKSANYYRHGCLDVSLNY